MRCAGGRLGRRLCWVVSLSALAALGACSSGTATWAGFAAVSVTSPLLRGLSQEVEVACRIAPERAANVTAVTADLSQIGGPIIRPLERIDDDEWGWSGRLIPQEAGERTVTFRASLDDGLFYSQTLTVRVNDPDGGGGGGGGGGGNLPPEVSDEVATSTGIVGVRGAATLTCTATDQDGTVESVVADLSAINGPDDAALTHGDGNTWRWEGQLSPHQVGEQTIPITATDDDGATGSGEATVTISDGFAVSVAPDGLELDFFEDQPMTFSASITPALPAGATVVYHWSTGTLLNGALVYPGIFPDSTEPDQSTIDTDTSSVQFTPRPQPWHWSMRLPLDTPVRCGATITLPVGEAAATGGSADVTISQLGLELGVEFDETIETDINGVVHRRFEAGFEWPINGATMWVVAFLEKPNEAGTVWNGKWIMPQVTTANGAKHIVDDGNTGLELDERTWRSDGSIPLQTYFDQRQAVRDIYTGWRAKVTGWPP